MYRGIKNLKSASEEIKLTAEDENLLTLCSKDPAFFIFEYVRTVDQNGHDTMMETSLRRRAELDTLENQRFIKSDWYRQSGYTTLVLSYFLWKAMFTPGLIFTYCAPKKAQAYYEFETHIRKAILALPYWMQPGVTEWTEHTVSFKNGSTIRARVAEYGSIAGVASDYLFVDDFGFLTDKKMLELTETEFKCAKNRAKSHLILGKAQVFGNHSEANTLYWKNCDIPFYVSMNVWKAESDADKEFEQEKRKALGDKVFEKEYVGTQVEKKTTFASLIDTLPDAIRKTRWKATFHSKADGWKWLEDHLVVSSVCTEDVKFNDKNYPGLTIRSIELEGFPTASLNLGGIVTVDINYYTWELGDTAGIVRYKCLCLPSMVYGGALEYSGSAKDIVMSTIKLIIIDRLDADEELVDYDTTLEDIRTFSGSNDTRDSISDWLEANVRL